MSRSLASIVPVWVLAVIGSVLVVALATPTRYFEWMSVVLAFLVFVTFVIQLSLATKEGLVVRMSASVGGAVVVLGIATLLMLPFVVL